MAFWMNSAIRALLACEDYLVAQILRRPGFHHMVRRVHRRIQDRAHGRDSNEPLRPGEATELPGTNENSNGFVKYFVEELRNQIRGTPSEPPPPPTRGPRPPRR